MNRTKRLMTAVTTSLLFTGALPGPAAAVPAFGQTAAQPDESWKTDPQVKDAAVTIGHWLDGTSCVYDSTGLTDKTKTKTQEDVVKQFPQFDPTLVQKALKLLVYYHAIRQMGDGTKDNPFCYCHTPTSGTG